MRAYQTSPEKTEEEQPESVGALSVNDWSPFLSFRNTISRVLNREKFKKTTEQTSCEINSSSKGRRFQQARNLALSVPSTWRLCAVARCAAPALPLPAVSPPVSRGRSGPALTCRRPPRRSMATPGCAPRGRWAGPGRSRLGSAGLGSSAAGPGRAGRWHLRQLRPPLWPSSAGLWPEPRGRCAGGRQGAALLPRGAALPGEALGESGSSSTAAGFYRASGQGGRFIFHPSLAYFWE